MKNTILGFVAVVATVVGVAYVTNTSVNVTTPAPVVNVEPSKVVVQSPDVNVQAPVVNVPRQTLGAVPTTDITENRFSFGGVEFVSDRTTRLTTGSTTLCVLNSPRATSTLLSANVRLLLATTSIVTMSRTTNPTASTSLTVITDTVTANVQKTIAASSTVNASAVFEPNTYLILKGNSANIGNGASGSCNAVWITI